MGDYRRWEEVLLTQRALGYRVFLFTPLQDSECDDYSFLDPAVLSPSLFPSVPVPPTQPESRYPEVAKAISRLDRLYGIGCMGEVVLSHLSANAPLLQEDLTATYNLSTCKYLQSAYELDRALAQFSERLSNREVASYLRGNVIANESDLAAIMTVIKREVVPPLRLYEFFQMDIGLVFAEFKAAQSAESEYSLSSPQVATLRDKGLEHFIRLHALIGEGEKRLGVKVDCGLVWAVCRHAKLEEPRVIRAVEIALKAINAELLARSARHQAMIYKNVESTIRYHKLARGEIVVTASNPLVPAYFHCISQSLVALRHCFVLETAANSSHDSAHKDFWYPLTRSLIVWPNTLKLHYGKGPKDAPRLWEAMETYITAMAKTFKGLKIENANNTPVHVLEHMSIVARRENPDIVLLASDVGAPVAAQLCISRVVRDVISCPDLPAMHKAIKSASKQHPTVRTGATVLKPVPLPVVLFDFTHYSQTLVQKRTAEDALANAALVAFAPLPAGSARGYDILLPHQITALDALRLYPAALTAPHTVMPVGGQGTEGPAVEIAVEYRPRSPLSTVEIRGSWDNWQRPVPMARAAADWFTAVLGFPTHCVGREYEFKFVLDGRDWVVSEGYQRRRDKMGMDNNVMAIAEEMIARPPVGKFQSMEAVRKYLNNLHQRLSEEGFIDFELQHPSADLTVMTRTNPYTLDSYTLIAKSAFTSSPSTSSLSGYRLPSGISRIECIAELTVTSLYAAHHSEYITGLPCTLMSYCTASDIVNVLNPYLPRSDTIDFRPRAQSAICVLRSTHGPRVSESLRMLQSHAFNLLENRTKADELVARLTVPDAAYLLWRCGPEEVANTRHGRDVYKIAGLQWFSFAGLSSLDFDFRAVEKTAKHPLFENLMQGNWLMDYHCQRISEWPLDNSFKQFFYKATEHIRELPRTKVPGAFGKLVGELVETLKRHIVNILCAAGSELIRCPDAGLIALLAVASTQFHSTEISGRSPSLSAGLPLNCIGAQRRRGRDTFMSLPGILLHTGRLLEAESEILDFARSMQEGLIPNHMCPETGTFEYHTRDTTWWFVRAVMEYVEKAGADVLRKLVPMRFGERAEMQLQDILQRIMQSHASGIHFRNPPHGAKLHPNWHEIGLDITLELDIDTGIVYGSNTCNCDTWMNAVSYAQLKTPRDGAPIETTALLFTATSFLAELHARDVFPYAGVALPDGEFLSYSDWTQRIRTSFEALYWLPVEDTGALADPSDQRTRGVYKDTVGAANIEDEYILRGNQCIAMAVAPALFDPSHAAIALGTVESRLVPKGGLGLYLEPPSDPRKATESLWLLGFYLKARNNFKKQTLAEVLGTVKAQRELIESSRWQSLPDAVESQTQVTGCHSQLRSIGVMLEALIDVVSSNI